MNRVIKIRNRMNIVVEGSVTIKLLFQFQNILRNFRF